MTRRDKWKRREVVSRYFEYKDKLRSFPSIQYLKKQDTLPDIVWYIPMPKSWSKKKKKEMNEKPHKQRPDIDNLQKRLLDAVYEEDSVVWMSGTQKKLRGYRGGILLTWTQIDS